MLFWLQLEDEKIMRMVKWSNLVILVAAGRREDNVYGEVEQSCYFGCSWRRRRICMVRWSNLVALVAAGRQKECV